MPDRAGVIETLGAGPGVLGGTPGAARFPAPSIAPVSPAPPPSGAVHG
jgi:hypothetical protein